MTQQIWAIGGYVNNYLLIRNRNCFEERSSRRRIRLQFEDPGVIDAQPKLFGRAEHAVRFDAANLAALELEPAGERRADGRERIGLPCLHVGRAAYDFDDPVPGIDLTQRETIGVRVLAHLEHARDQDVAQILMDRHDTVDGCGLAREAVGDILAF
jgi:hypothetical protein